jgi:hypothetical protein
VQPKSGEISVTGENDQYPSIYLQTSGDNHLRHPHIQISYCGPVLPNERVFLRRDLAS